MSVAGVERRPPMCARSGDDAVNRHPVGHRHVGDRAHLLAAAIPHFHVVRKLPHGSSRENGRFILEMSTYCPSGDAVPVTMPGLPTGDRRPVAASTNASCVVA